VDGELIIIGGGLAGCEAAWQAAERGIHVILYEMRPKRMTGAHTGGLLGELVCSNSLGSLLKDRPTGLLQEELRRMNSLLVRCAEQTAVPAGRALAVDRIAFSTLIGQYIKQHENIEVIRKEVTAIPSKPVILATGPLTSPRLAGEIHAFIGEEYLYFFDAIAPIVSADSIDMQVAFRASRYDNNESGDYLNCPMNKDEYNAFVAALLHAERISLKDYEKSIAEGVRGGFFPFFERCLPIEVLAQHSPDALAFGPLRPIGLIDQRSGRRPYAVVQLRQDNLAVSLFSLVGFQTNLTYPEQVRLIHMIPGLGKAEIVRYGQMHRNTYILSPRILRNTLQSIKRADVFFAGQLCGAEGYVGNIGTGLLAGWNAANFIHGCPLVELPRQTMLGSLVHYLTHADPFRFQPMKSNFGLLPPLEDEYQQNSGRRRRAAYYSERALSSLQEWLSLCDPGLDVDRASDRKSQDFL